MQGRRLCLAVLVVLLCVAAGLGFSAPRAAARPKQSQAAGKLAAIRRLQAIRLLNQIDVKQAETWRWQRLTGRPPTPKAGSAQRIESPAYRQWVLDLWTRRAVQARTLALHPPRLRDWLCIHRHEGAWNDPSAPYYGGLQMDLAFQRTYGARLLRTKGTADRWTPLEQIWVAVRAYRSGRGFYPWPNTARYCGLI